MNFVDYSTLYGLTAPEIRRLEEEALGEAEAQQRLAAESLRRATEEASNSGGGLEGTVSYSDYLSQQRRAEAAQRRATGVAGGNYGLRAVRQGMGGPALTTADELADRGAKSVRRARDESGIRFQDNQRRQQEANLRLQREAYSANAREKEDAEREFADAMEAWQRAPQQNRGARRNVYNDAGGLMGWENEATPRLEAARERRRRASLLPTS